MSAKICYGVTFSHLHAQWLGLNVPKTFYDTLALKPAYVRLCCYWKECEPQPGVFDFSSLEKLLQICEKKKQAVILTVGMKAPRWPEFHLPAWTSFQDPLLHSHVLTFLRVAVKRLKKYNCIQYWQAENEPIERMVTNFRSISFSFFSQEVDSIRSLDQRPILGTMLANSRYLFSPERKLLSVCDALGVDLYFKIPIFGMFTLPFLQLPGGLERLLQRKQQPVWITELQAEPWESTNPFTKLVRRVPMTVSQLRANLKRAKAMGATTILFWGVEYWFSQAENGDSSLLLEAKKIFSSKR